MPNSTGTIPHLFSLLCSVRIHRGKAGEIGTEFMSGREMSELYKDLTTRSLPLFQAHKIHPQEGQECLELASKEWLGE